MKTLLLLLVVTLLIGLLPPVVVAQDPLLPKQPTEWQEEPVGPPIVPDEKPPLWDFEFRLVNLDWDGIMAVITRWLEDHGW